MKKIIWLLMTACSGFTEMITSVEKMGTGKKLKWNKVPENDFIYPEYPADEVIDHIVVINVK